MASVKVCDLRIGRLFNLNLKLRQPLNLRRQRVRLSRLNQALLAVSPRRMKCALQNIWRFEWERFERLATMN